MTLPRYHSFYSLATWHSIPHVQHVPEARYGRYGRYGPRHIHGLSPMQDARCKVRAGEVMSNHSFSDNVSSCPRAQIRQESSHGGFPNPANLFGSLASCLPALPRSSRRAFSHCFSLQLLLITAAASQLILPNYVRPPTCVPCPVCPPSSPSLRDTPPTHATPAMPHL